MIPINDQFRILWSGTSFTIRVSPGYILGGAGGLPPFETVEESLALPANATRYIYGDTAAGGDVVASATYLGPDEETRYFIGTVVTGQTGVISVDQPVAIVPVDGADATSSKTLTIGGLVVNGQSSANVSNVGGARAPMGGVRVINDNSAASALSLNTLPFALGSDDFTISMIAEIVSNPISSTLVTISYTGFLMFTLRQPNAGGVFTCDHSTGSVNFPAIPTSLLGTVAAIFLERVGTTLTLWINGILVGSVTAPSFGFSPDASNIVRFGGAFIASQRNNGVIHRAWMFDHTLTQADRDFITTRGRIPNDLQWAPTSLIVSPTILNGGFETAGGGGADVFANWGEFTSGTGVITRDTVDFSPNYSSTASAKLAGVSGDVEAINSLTPLLVAGKRYRLTNDMKRTFAGALSVTTSSTNTFLASFTLTTSWATYTADFVSSVSEGVKYTNAGASSLWVDNVIIQRLGAFLALDFGVGCGNQAIDLSGNGTHATLVAPFEHVVPLRAGHVRQRVTASGNTQITAGIPTNARITAVTANSAGTVTLSIGNASAGTQIVNAQVLASGRQDVTLAGRFSTTGNLWANLSSAVQVDITVHYEIAD